VRREFPTAGDKLGGRPWDRVPTCFLGPDQSAPDRMPAAGKAVGAVFPGMGLTLRPEAKSRYSGSLHVFTKNRERLLQAEIAHKFLAELLNHREVRGLPNHAQLYASARLHQQIRTKCKFQ
jgi:hypothetical protein